MPPVEPTFHTVSFQPSLLAAREAGRAMRTFLAGLGLDEEDLFACELALVEAATNAVQHAPAENRYKPIVAECLYTGDRIELRVHDHTAGFDLPDCIPPPAPTIDRGRGLYLITAMMHRVQYVRGERSNTLVMHRRRKKA